mmetsp:Transcript_26795/g.75162  ORF Transcript_26795/g.75162 Transcript_26795/m.75162 type:complete len:108 (-) Transcript_26795:92-415(-)
MQAWRIRNRQDAPMHSSKHGHEWMDWDEDTASDNSIGDSGQDSTDGWTNQQNGYWMRNSLNLASSSILDFMHSLLASFPFIRRIVHRLVHVLLMHGWMIDVRLLGSA